MVLFFILFLAFWILYYYFDSRVDAYIEMWKNSVDNKNITITQRELSHKYELSRKSYDLYKRLCLHIFVTLPVIFFGANLFLFFSMLLLSLSIRPIVHSYLVNRFLGIDINHLGNTDWVDIFLREVEKTGISQWYVRFAFFIIFFVLSILFLAI